MLMSDAHDPFDDDSEEAKEFADEFDRRRQAPYERICDFIVPSRFAGR
jgi:hypothetical protein